MSRRDGGSHFLGLQLFPVELKEILHVLYLGEIFDGSSIGVFL
jgi:hypothetical protein